jgi:hypothetical protein
VVDLNEVACERTSVEGFPQAPQSDGGGGRWNLAIGNAQGEFRWAEGNIGGADTDQDSVLEYGHVDQINGWVIEANSDGTRFTNSSSGRGMFVSVGNVYSF